MDADVQGTIYILRKHTPRPSWNSWPPESARFRVLMACQLSPRVSFFVACPLYVFTR